MFKVYFKNGNQTACVYNDTFMTEGTKSVSPKLTLSEGNAGQFDIKVSPGNDGYNLIEMLKTEVTITKNDVEYWSGRIISVKEDFYKSRSVVCEGELAYLNDTTQPQIEYGEVTPRNFLSGVLTQHNNKCSKQFSVGSVTVTGDYYRYTNYESTIQSINERLVGKLGGYIHLRKVNGVRYLDYIAESDRPSSNQEIRFGTNLLDFTKSFNSTEFCTVIVPLGARLNEEYTAGDEGVERLDTYLTIESVNSGSPYLANQVGVDAFGWIERVVHFDDIDDPEELLYYARLYLSSVQFDNMVLEVNAVDMGYLGGNVDAINLSDKVYVISEPHGLNRSFPVTKVTIPLDNPGGTTFTMGSEVSVSLSTKTVNGNDYIMDRLEHMPSSSEILNISKANAAAIIDSFQTGYITITHNSNGSNELYITDRVIPDGYDPANIPNLCDRYWRWNVNGLGYYNKNKTGYNNSNSLVMAMTMNGEICADFITTGHLSADRINTGVIRSQDPNSKFVLNMTTGEVVMYNSTFHNGTFSGTINLGGSSGSIGNGGILNLYDSNNRLKFRLDSQYGLYSYGIDSSGYNEVITQYGQSGWLDAIPSELPVEVPVEGSINVEGSGDGIYSLGWFINAIAYYDSSNRSNPFGIIGINDSKRLTLVNHRGVDILSYGSGYDFRIRSEGDVDITADYPGNVLILGNTTSVTISNAIVAMTLCNTGYGGYVSFHAPGWSNDYEFARIDDSGNLHLKYGGQIYYDL